MNYIRTSAGGMMAITPKADTLISVKKQVTAPLKPSKKSNKTLPVNNK